MESTNESNSKCLFYRDIVESFQTFQLRKVLGLSQNYHKKDEMRGNEEKLPKITTLKKPSPQVVTRSPE